MAITAKNLITVLPIDDAIILPINGMPEQHQHPKERTRRTCRWQLRLQTDPLNFARERGLTLSSDDVGRYTMTSTNTMNF